MKTVIPDLKTERLDVAQPLPAPLMVLPLLVYAGILGAIAMSSHAFLQMRQAEQKAREARQANAGEQAQIAQLKSEFAAIEAEEKNAKEVQQWIQGTNQLQPIVLALARSMDAESTISSMTLARKEEIPSQVQMGLQITSPHGPQQIDALRNAMMTALSYRSFSENIDNKKGGKRDLSFDCTWIKTEILDPGR